MLMPTAMGATRGTDFVYMQCKPLFWGVGSCVLIDEKVPDLC